MSPPSLRIAAATRDFGVVRGLLLLIVLFGGTLVVMALIGRARHQRRR